MNPDSTENLKATAMLRLILAKAGDDWRCGDAITPHGMVAVYDQGFASGNNRLTRLDFVAGGRLHVAIWRRTFSDRYLLTLACRFAKASSAMGESA